MARTYVPFDADDPAFQSAVETLRDLREQAESEVKTLCEDFIGMDTFNFADMVDSTSWGSDPSFNAAVAWFGGFNFRTSWSLAYTRPGELATVFINETMRRMVVAASRAFCRMNPYWIAAKNARIAYNVGQGHTYSVISRVPGKPVDKDLQRKVMDEVQKFCKVNQWRKRQAEKVTRGDRDGEFFLRKYRNDEVLRVRFVEPMAVQTPGGMSEADGVWFGIKFNQNNYEEPEGYFIRQFNFDGGPLTADQEVAWSRMIEAKDIQHRKYNVDLSAPRGVPTTYALRNVLTQAMTTATSMARQVEIRSRIAMIVKQVNATLGQIQPLLQRNRATQIVGAGGQMLNAFNYKPGTILNTNDQRTYEFPSPNLETDKQVMSVKTDVSMACAALGFADFVLSGDSKSNFASALVKEGPMDKAVSCTQAELIEDDIEILEDAIQHAADAGRLDAGVLEQIAINAEPPNIIVRNRIAEAQADEILIRSGAMSTETMAERHGLDPSVEGPRIKANPPPALVAAQAAANPMSGDQRSHQAPLHSKSTARGVPGGKEPGPGANPQRAEEDVLESSHDPVPQDAPTQAEMAMAQVWITDDWLRTTKAEIRALPRTEGPPNPDGLPFYEPGVKGLRLGVVDGQTVWSVDMRALSVRHSAPDVVIAGNSERWKWCPEDVVFVDWSFTSVDRSADLLHECCEFRMMCLGRFGYPLAHKCANRFETDWLLSELRPELQALVPEKD